ncbi:MAG TPA: MBL fold metallo-hydrolase [Dehalococcoidia bacterium]|jgi:L-ascorbate metabolism protein UlaG (beta-lactamase superfamily)|nr:MBL fold metallo-hydrolase [Dehalococcoidia bacterium]
MEITWLGHSCFLIKGKEKTIITDPCHPDLGYRLGEPEADIATLSHFHPGHSYIEGVANDPKQIKSPGEYEIGGTFITGISTFHDDKKGELKGKNTIYVTEMDGITLCHLGDLGHPLGPNLVEELGDVDILFLPVGEVSTIPVDTAVEIVRQLEPPIVIPMHYKTEAFTGNLSLVDKFLDKMRIRELEAKPKLSITSSSLPTTTQTIVLNYL